MSNTNMESLYPEFWFGAFDKLDMGILNAQNLVSRDVEKMLADKGDTVNVPLTPDMGKADDWTPGVSISKTNVVQKTVPVVLQHSKRKTIALTDKELSLSPYDLIEKYGVGMAKSILDAVNESIYDELRCTDNIIAGAITQDKITDAKVALDNKRAMANRFMLMDSTDLGVLAKESKKANEYGSNQALREGFVDRLSGFDIYQNSVIEKYTPADVAGAVDAPGGVTYPAGTTEMVVDTFADALNPIKKGVAFKFYGHDTQYVALSTTQDTDGNTIGIKFFPATTVNVADNVVITATSTRSAIGFLPSAVAFAARPYSLGDGIGIRKSVNIINGLPIRSMVWTDSDTTNLNVQFDILYGVQVVAPQRIVRIDTT